MSNLKKITAVAILVAVIGYVAFVVAVCKDNMQLAAWLISFAGISAWIFLIVGAVNHLRSCN